ncbi:MAG: hypothetical protein P1U74_11435 [Legionellaceae bacterium]|nr:hypothetical protein [Legionellaceae bacterium]
MFSVREKSYKKTSKKMNPLDRLRMASSNIQTDISFPNVVPCKKMDNSADQEVFDEMETIPLVGIYKHGEIRNTSLPYRKPAEFVPIIDEPLLKKQFSSDMDAIVSANSVVLKKETRCYSLSTFSGDDLGDTSFESISSSRLTPIQFPERSQSSISKPFRKTLPPIRSSSSTGKLESLEHKNSIRNSRRTLRNVEDIQPGIATTPRPGSKLIRSLSSMSSLSSADISSDNRCGSDSALTLPDIGLTEARGRGSRNSFFGSFNSDNTPTPRIEDQSPFFLGTLTEDVVVETNNRTKKGPGC